MLKHPCIQSSIMVVRALIGYEDKGSEEGFSLAPQQFMRGEGVLAELS